MSFVTAIAYDNNDFTGNPVTLNIAPDLNGVMHVRASEFSFQVENKKSLHLTINKDADSKSGALRVSTNTLQFPITHLKLDDNGIETISTDGLILSYATTLIHLDASNFGKDVKYIEENGLSNMCYNLDNLEIADFSSFGQNIETISSNGFNDLFGNCDKLNTVDFRNFATNGNLTSVSTSSPSYLPKFPRLLSSNAATVYVNNQWEISEDNTTATYLNTNNNVLTGGPFTWNLVNGHFEDPNAVESSTIGDPYIQPLHGTMYKLPDKNATYRILQDSKERMYVNAYVDTIEQTVINKKVTYIAKTYFNNIDANIYNFEHMYFFTKVCIHYNDESWSYNLLDCSYTDIPQWIILSKPQISTYNSASGLYQNEPMIVTKATIANSITLSFAWFPNPQVNTGISLHSFTNAALDGLLISRYTSDSALVDSLDSTYIVKFEQSKNAKLYAKEIFYPHNQPSYVRRIAVL